MLAILLLVFAGMCALGTLAVIGSKMSGGTRAWLTVYNVCMIIVMVLSAIQLMH